MNLNDLVCAQKTIHMQDTGRLSTTHTPYDEHRIGILPTRASMLAPKSQFGISLMLPVPPVTQRNSRSPEWCPPEHHLTNPQGTAETQDVLR